MAEQTGIPLDWGSVIIEIEDLLIPHLKLDVWERSLYYCLLRQTRLRGSTSGVFSLTVLATLLSMSEWKVREVIRSLDSKGCVSVKERSQKGHLLLVHLPAELGLPILTEEHLIVDIESLDFFTGRKWLGPLLVREGNRCFYCLRDVTSESCALDHVVPRVDGVDNSYRNIVISCHDCNARKQETVGEDYLRFLYRRSLLSEAEFEDRMHALEELTAGRLVPKV
jgi:biotin operon repressor